MYSKFLRHLVASVVYRFNKSIRSYPEGFGDFSLGKDSRTSEEIVNHLFHLARFSRMAVEKSTEKTQPPEKLDLSGEIERFLGEMRSLDKALKETEIGDEFTNKLIQGPLADMLTHVGQLAMMQGIAGNLIPGEDFSKANIKAGEF